MIDAGVLVGEHPGVRARQRAACPGTDPGCDMAPNQADTVPGTLMVITGLLTMVVGAAFAIDGSMTRVSQVQ